MEDESLNKEELNEGDKNDKTVEKVDDDNTKDEKESMFTKKDVDKMISDATAKLKEKFKKQLSQKVSEAEKVAKMNAEQKSDYEKQRSIQELEEREAAVARREMEIAARETLEKRTLPTDLSAILNYESEEKCSESIDIIEKAFNTAVSARIDEKIAKSRTNPKDGGKNPPSDAFLQGFGK